MEKQENIPPILFQRNEYGLLNHIKYYFTEDGFVDWRKMIPSKYLTPNKDKTTETDISKLADNQLLILLGGIKELAQLRGFASVNHDTQIFQDYVLSKCTISWIPNFETEGRIIQFSSLADATLANTKSFASDFLAAIAENRAFVRCVRNFLKINIVSSEELGKSDKEKDNQVLEETVFNPVEVLNNLLSSKKLTFEDIKKKLILEKFNNSENFTTLEDIPSEKLYELITRITKIKN